MASGSSEYVWLELKRNRGWPWPESSYGLTPMFGEDGWCRACGVPMREQTGALVLQRRGLTPSGVWTPNWRFDVVCMEGAVATRVEQRFAVYLRPVTWPSGDGPEVWQLVFPAVGPDWFDSADVAAAARNAHGSEGVACASCGVWRWLPVGLDDLPPPRRNDSWHGHAAIASPEWFGAGKRSFRQVVVLRELGELLAAASPADFTVQPVL